MVDCNRGGVDVAPSYASLETYTKVNPSLEVTKFATLVETHLNGKIESLIAQVEQNTDNYNSATSLVEALTKILLKNDAFKNKVIDFDLPEFKEIKQIIEELNRQHILDANDIQDYKFDSKTSLEIFIAKLEGLKTKISNQSQIPLIQMQPLMNQLELMIKIAKAIMDAEANLDAHINSMMRG
ncbi:MAG: hypothetical protein KR126chlam6_00173 [Candidatus Anoxychlamydiales bacterium]|nr:hypothetical protein [Candidatus Anoxychlamydiales bacterium]